jgi:hypothetical protein
MTALPTAHRPRAGVRAEHGAVNIFGEIDPEWGSVSALQVMQTLRENPSSPVRVTISSRGVMRSRVWRSTRRCGTIPAR